MKSQNIERFIEAQEGIYQAALEEVKSGKKQSHWMWFIFPQIQGLGYSSMAIYYGIRNMEEAIEYLQHPILGSQLIEISTAILDGKETNPLELLGFPDNLKLKSSMTLFSQVPDAPEVFKQVLERFFGGEVDEKTMDILGTCRR